MMTATEFRAGLARLTGWPETYAYYLIRKVTDTLGIFAAFVFLLSVPILWAAWAAWVLYVGWGLWSWYHGTATCAISLSFAPGQFGGDLLYHGEISAIAPLCAYVFVAGWPWWVRLVAVSVWALVWAVLYAAGYGLMRNPGDPR